MGKCYIIREAAPSEFGEVAEFCAGKGRDARSREIVRRRKEWLRDLAGEGLVVVLAVDGTPPALLKWRDAYVARDELTMLHDGLAVGLLEYLPIEKTLYPVEGTGYLFLDCLWVIPPYQGKGVGAALLSHLIREARERGVGVATLSWRGRKPSPDWDYMPAAFFRRFGFEEVETAGETVLMALDCRRSSRPALVRGGDVEEKGYVYLCHPSCPASMTAADEVRAAAGTTPIQVVEGGGDEARRRGALFGLCRDGRLLVRRVALIKDWEEITKKGDGDSSPY